MTNNNTGEPSVSPKKNGNAKTYAGMTRRTLCMGIGGAAALLGLGTLKFVPSTPLVRPPGGQDVDRLLSACIRCQRCLEACPRNVIVPAHMEDGLVGMRTPTLAFSDNWCDWCAEENGGKPLCAAVCPTKALELPSAATAENVILGKAVISTKECLAFRLIGCRYCYDACPYEAIELDSEYRPYIVEDKCNGCGACESVCVSLKNATIIAGATERAVVIRPLEA